MIIERCRELALRAPARVVFPDALDQREFFALLWHL